MKLLLSKDVFLSIVIQLVSLFAPFIILKYIFVNGTNSYVLEYESTVSLIAFFSVVINFATLQLTSADKKLHDDLGNFLNGVVLLKLVLWFPVFLVTICFYYVFQLEIIAVITVAVVIFFLIFDLHFIFIMKGVTYLYQSIILIRLVAPIISILLTNSFYVGLMLGYMFSAILQWMVMYRFFNYEFKLKSVFGDVSLSYAQNLFNSNLHTSLADVISALFSQLDSFIISNIGIAQETSIVYVVIRRLVRACLGVLNYVYSILFFKVKIHGFFSHESKKVLVLILIVILTSLIGYYLVGKTLISLFANQLVLGYAGFDTAFFILGLVLVFGPLKMVFVNTFVYVRGFFGINLIALIICMFSYVLILFYSKSSEELAFSRVMVDFLYVPVVMALVYVSNKFRGLIK